MSWKKDFPSYKNRLVGASLDLYNEMLDAWGIGGRNYITHNPDKWEYYSSLYILQVEIEPNTTYTFTDYSTVAVEGLSVDNKIVEKGETYTFESVSSGVVALFVAEEDFEERLGTIFRFKLEKGNKATDWSPAPEDMLEQFYTKVNR